MIHIGQIDQIAAVAFEKAVAVGQLIFKRVQRLGRLHAAAGAQIKDHPFVLRFGRPTHTVSVPWRSSRSDACYPRLKRGFIDGLQPIDSLKAQRPIEGIPSSDDGPMSRTEAPKA